MLARGTTLLPHSVDHARAWHDAGYDVIVVVIAAAATDRIDVAALAFARGILIRQNRGYDFGAWAAAIAALTPAITRCDVVAIANDSVLGPSSRFAAMVLRAEAAPGDLVGLTLSREITCHFQSFVLFFKSAALRSNVFEQFWGNVRSGDRRYVIDHYELTLKAIFEASGIRTHALWSLETDGNPTLSLWNLLLTGGFPYLKVELLRDNPHRAQLEGWDDIAKAHDFDLDRLRIQIDALHRSAERDWAIDRRL